jgi:Uncharacterized protein conserved in bacteria (DUF2272)
LVRQAGGEDKLAYGEAHHIYIRHAFNGGKGLYNSAVDIASNIPQTGDLVCVGRDGAAAWTFENFKTWAGNPSSGGILTHCDVVVAVNGTSITAIGGNLGDQVKQNIVSKGAYQVLLKVTRAQANDRLVDIGIIVDVSGSFGDDQANFRNEATTIVSLIHATYPNALFGLATFQRY